MMPKQAVDDEVAFFKRLSRSYFGQKRAPGKLADIFEHADVTLSYWNTKTSGATERQITDIERKLIVKALRSVDNR